MAHDNQLPLGARVLPGVDLKLWLQLVAAACLALLAVAVLAVVWS